MENSLLDKLAKEVEYGFWEKYDESHTVIRLATDWGNTNDEVDALIAVLKAVHNS